MTTPTLLLHGIASCWMDARGEMVPYDEPPTDPRGVVKNEVEFAVSSSLSENRLRSKIGMKAFRLVHFFLSFSFRTKMKDIDVLHLPWIIFWRCSKQCFLYFFGCFWCASTASRTDWTFNWRKLKYLKKKMTKKHDLNWKFSVSSDDFIIPLGRIRIHLRSCSTVGCVDVELKLRPEHRSCQHLVSGSWLSMTSVVKRCCSFC